MGLHGFLHGFFRRLLSSLCSFPGCLPGLLRCFLCQSGLLCCFLCQPGLLRRFLHRPEQSLGRGRFLYRRFLCHIRLFLRCCLRLSSSILCRSRFLRSSILRGVIRRRSLLLLRCLHHRLPGFGGLPVNLSLRFLRLARKLGLRCLHLRGVGYVRGKLCLDLLLRRGGSLGLRKRRGLAQVGLRPVLRLFLLFLEAVVVDLLLLRRQRRVLLLQLQGPDHILPAVEPEHQVITGGKPLLHISGLDLKAGQLIGPLLVVLLIQVLLQDINLLVKGRSPAAVDLILQNILVIIMRGRLDILRVILDGLVKLPQLDAALHQPVQNRPSHRAAPVRAKQKRLAVLIALQHLVDLADHHQRLHIAHSLPVDGIRDPCSALIVLGSNQAIDLLQFFLIFPLVHSVTPLLFESEMSVSVY